LKPPYLKPENEFWLSLFFLCFVSLHLGSAFSILLLSPNNLPLTHFISLLPRIWDGLTPVRPDPSWSTPLVNSAQTLPFTHVTRRKEGTEQEQFRGFQVRAWGVNKLKKSQNVFQILFFDRRRVYNIAKICLARSYCPLSTSYTIRISGLNTSHKLSIMPPLSKSCFSRRELDKSGRSVFVSSPDPRDG